MGARLAGGLKTQLLTSLPYIGKHLEPIASNPVGATVVNMAPEYIAGLATGQGLIGSGVSAGISEAAQWAGGKLGRRFLGDSQFANNLADNARTQAFRQMGNLPDGVNNPMYPFLEMQYGLTGGDVGEAIGSTIGGVAGLGVMPLAQTLFFRPEEKPAQSQPIQLQSPPTLNAEQVKKAQQRALEQAALNQYYAESLGNYPV